MKLPANHLGVFVHLAKSEAGKAKWNPMFPLGAEKYRSDFPDGKIEISAEMCRAFAANYARMGKPRLAGNYFHRDGDSAPADVPVDQLVKSGTIVDVEFRPDDSEMPGLWALVEWTPRAAGYIANGEIDQISPEWSLNYRDRNTNALIGPALLGFGLVQDPLFKEMPRAAASADGGDSPAERPQPQEQTMDKKLLAALLVLSESASDAEITAEIKRLQGTESAKLTASSEKLKAVEETLKATAKQLSEKDAEISTLKASIAEGEKKAKAAAAESFKASLLGKGIAVPVATKLHDLFLKDEEMAKSLAADMKPAVSTEEKGVNDKPTDGSGKSTDKFEAAQQAFFAEVDKIRTSDKVGTEEALFRAEKRFPALHKAMADAAPKKTEARA